MATGKSLQDQILFQRRMTADGIKRSFDYNMHCTLAKDQYTATTNDQYIALSIAIRDRIVERWITTQQRYHRKNLKRVYYMSMEFLIGRLLGNNIINIGLWKEVKKAMENMGLDLETMRDQEVDAGLGNGGLGRLAACFLDSMATLGIPAHGYGIRYDYGIFTQKIVNGYQVEIPEEWLSKGNPWEVARPEYTVRIKFYGRVTERYDKNGKLVPEWVDTEDVVALPYDIPVVGYHNDVVNTLRLWSARSTEEFDLEYFNDGDYERAVFKKMFSENISRVLYPNDMLSQGKELRLKQEYFFTAASISDIIRRFKSENNDWKQFPEKVAVQLNDTHPSLAVVELMRILLDEEGLDWDTAWDITTRTFAYTNHTVMPEALETWPVPLFERLLPRHLRIIYEINGRFLGELSRIFPGDMDRLRRMSLIEEGEPKKVRMAYLCVIGSHSVNGVSELHTRLIKTRVFRDFFEMMPKQFNNKTNGITQRRWLLKSNMSLADLITSEIGEGWVTNLYETEKLLKYKDDAAFREKWRKAKAENKRLLADHIFKSMGIMADPNSMFDIQVKRMHEYKRQLLFCMYIIAQYMKLKKDPKSFLCPRTFIIGGKSAPGYFMAKRIIKFANNIAETINRDKGVNEYIKLVFLENYRVSLAEKIFPASDLSEQISTAGTEASGTGCMKFMLNGALTIGTHDGANIEIAEAVGRDNIFMFGLKLNEAQELRDRGYNPRDYISRSPALGEVFRMIESGAFSLMEPGIFDPILQSLYSSDPFLVCADFDAYCAEQDKISKLYKDKNEWTKKSIINVAKSGRFSSDSTIAKYAKEIWDVPFGNASSKDLIGV